MIEVNKEEFWKIPKVLICDFDGCLTSKEDRTYFNPDPNKYHASETILSRIKKFCDKYGAKVVISSNWRKFDKDGVWTNSNGSFVNPLDDLINRLSGYYYCTLPKLRHMPKSQVLLKWLSEYGTPVNFVVFDDDLNEGYQNISDFKIKDRFILCDINYGITDKDLEKAKDILNNL